MRRVAAVAALLALLGFAAARADANHGSTGTTCTAAHRAAAQAALTKYRAAGAAKRKAYFAKHKQKSARSAYDKRQRATLARLRAAAGCAVIPPTDGSCAPTLDSGGNTTNGVGPLRDAGVRGIGTLHAVVLFVDFPDAPATETAQSAFDTATSGVSQYYAAQSYGRLTLDFTPDLEWYRMSKPAGAYGFGRGQFTFEEQLAYMQEAVNLANADVDFSKYQLVYVVATRNAAAIDYSPAFDPNRDPAFALKADGNLIYGGATIGSDIYNAGWGWTVLAHETGHVFGMPDYYDIPNFDPNDYQQQFHYAGGWTIMSWNPTHTEFFAWDKYREGWIDPSQIRCQDTAGSTTQQVTPQENAGGIKMIVAKMSPSTAVVAEVRAKSGADAGVCSSGVLVYTLDAHALSGQGPLQVQTPHPGDPNDAGNVNQCSILWDAPLQAGESWQGSGVEVDVLAANPDGSYTVRVTHS
jgi:M6 family metalloprotease-like protein